jgi:uncharacterized membrane protein YraQ (UPF0718 family)
MSDQLSSTLEFFIVVFGELAILFIAISFVVSLINHKLPPEKIKRLLTGNKGYGIAVGLGALTPFCSCSTLPMTIGLIKARAAFGPIMAFLFTSPLLNPFIVGLFWLSFGPKITLVYSSFVILLAVFSGYLLQKLNFERFIKLTINDSESNKRKINNTVCQENSQSNKSRCFDKNQKKPNKPIPLLLLSETIKQFLSFAPYMIIGVAVGAILHGYVPTSAFENLANYNLLILIPLAAIIGIFLYVRASTMVPIATSLIAKGMASGAVISLTIAGAGASLPEMIMMKKMFHWPLMFAFIVVVFATACITGFAIELI